MASPLIDLMDSQLSLGRLIWIMDDETADRLLELSRRHLELVKEALDRNFPRERKMQIRQEIEDIRYQIDKTIVSFKQSI
jgi:hypothetical protein